MVSMVKAWSAVQSVHILTEQEKKKEENWLSPMTKAPTPTEKSEKHRDNIQKRHQNFDNTTIADRLRTVSWSNSSQPNWCG